MELITRSFNEGRDRRGSTIGEPTSFFAGAAVAPAVADLEREARLLGRKVAAGAGFLLTQPLYDVAPLRALRTAYEHATGLPLEIPVIGGVLPLVTARHARFLHNEVPGIAIPDEVRSRMERAGDNGWPTGRAIALELIQALRAEGLAGVYLMPQFGRYDLAAEVVEAARG